MPELFAHSESLSPKLAWLRKHGLLVRKADVSAFEYECLNSAHTKRGLGNTEEEACLDYAERYYVKHWTIEAFEAERALYAKEDKILAQIFDTDCVEEELPAVVLEECEE